MKFLHKLLILISIVGLASCNVFELEDYLENPNGVAPEGAEIDFLYNNIQLGFEDFNSDIWDEVSELTRQQAMIGGFTYTASYQAVQFDDIWYDAYANILPDIQLLNTIAEERGLTIYAGTAKIMEAYVLMTLVDLFGDVPFSQALQGTDVISPAADDDASIYEAALTLLDEAVVDLTDATSATPAVDIFYGGDTDKWIALANTLKLRAYLQTRLVDSNAGSKIAELVGRDDIIDEASEDFQFQYGNQRLNPNSRHPFYTDAYEATDGDYMNNWYMWLLVGEKEMVDPRTRFYFYRQERDLTDEDPNIWDCIYSLLPDRAFIPEHYTSVDPDMPYCVASDLEEGYFGRDHGNGSGIPPDGPIRTVYGLYPGGGSFDDNDNSNRQNNGVDGATGEGIQPIMLSSYVYFLRAEAALVANSGEDAREMLSNAIGASMDKVFSFADFVDGSKVVATTPITLTLAEAYLDPLDSLKTVYTDMVLAEYDAASEDEKLNIVIREYFIAAWGNAIETYNAYRRTGKPNNIQPGIDPGIGAYPRSVLYPSDYVNLNANATQKDPADASVFWDTDATSLR